MVSLDSIGVHWIWTLKQNITIRLGIVDFQGIRSVLRLGGNASYYKFITTIFCNFSLY